MEKEKTEVSERGPVPRPAPLSVSLLLHPKPNLTGCNISPKKKDVQPDDQRKKHLEIFGI